MDKDQKVGYIALGIISVVIIAAVFMMFKPNTQTESAKVDNSYTMGVSNGEELAMAYTRQAIAQSRVDGTGSITETTCYQLKDIATGFDSSADWFKDCSVFLSGDTPDTDSKHVVKLSDGDYCATFTLDTTESVVDDYSFEDGGCRGYSIEITE